MTIPESLAREAAYRRACGDTYQEIADWLWGQYGLKRDASSIWRYFNPPAKPRPVENKRHHRWKQLRDTGVAVPEIARLEKVSKQAVYQALKRLDELDTLSS